MPAEMKTAAFGSDPRSSGERDKALQLVLGHVGAVQFMGGSTDGARPLSEEVATQLRELADLIENRDCKRGHYDV